MNPFAQRALCIGAIIVLALSLGGCGRRGALELPPGAGPPQSTAAASGAAAEASTLGEATAQRPHDKTDIAIRPKKPFVLDPLL